MSRALATALAATLALGAGCTAHSSSATLSGHTTLRASTTSAPSTTTTTSPTPTLPPLHLSSAFASATHLIDAWRSNDRPAAGQAASPAAVDSLFAQPYQATQSRGCDGGQPESDCFYRLGSSGGLRLHVTRQGDGSWVVTEASLAG